MPEELMCIRQSADVTIIDVNEYLGSYAVAELRKTLADLVGRNIQKIVVNLSQVQHINSVAIGTLAGTAKQLRLKDGDLKVFGLADNIRRTFDLIGASSIVEIYDSEDSALSNF
jgi:anti-sigma B factor antagonist